MRTNRLLKISAVFCMALGLTAGTVEAVKINGRIDRTSGIVLEIQGIAPSEVVDYQWNGNFITEDIQAWLDEGSVVLQEEADGFSLTFSPNLGPFIGRFSDGRFGVVLENGTRISAPIALDTAHWDIKQSNNWSTDSCGGHSSTGNPYPCCDNNKNGKFSDSFDGNCTWWAWKKVFENWGLKWPKWGDAEMWDDWAALRARPVNSTSGYVILPVPTQNSVGVSNSLRPKGHVAWISNVGSGMVTASEMRCYVNSSPNARTTTYKSATFQSYIVGMQIYDFWVKSATLTSSRTASVTSPNFDAQFKLRNVTSKEKYRIQRLAMAVHDSSGRFLWNFFRAPGNSMAAIYTPGELFSGAADGIDRGEYVMFPKSYAFFTGPGSYRIVAKIQLMDNTWVDVGYYNLTVK